MSAGLRSAKPSNLVMAHRHVRLPFRVRRIAIGKSFKRFQRYLIVALGGCPVAIGCGDVAKKNCPIISNMRIVDAVAQIHQTFRSRFGRVRVSHAHLDQRKAVKARPVLRIEFDRLCIKARRLLAVVEKGQSGTVAVGFGGLAGGVQRSGATIRRIDALANRLYGRGALTLMTV